MGILICETQGNDTVVVSREGTSVYQVDSTDAMMMELRTLVQVYAQRRVPQGVQERLDKFFDMLKGVGEVQT